MKNQYTIILVLKNSDEFGFRDVQLITSNILDKWKSLIKPRIICFWDKASQDYKLGNLEIIPLYNNWKGTWGRMFLYSPKMEQYRPFLYIDLDTAIIQSVEKVINLIKDESKFIVLEDFYQKGQLATGLVWFPANCKKLDKVWEEWNKSNKSFPYKRMDYFLRKIIQPDLFWQDLTNGIVDFKPKHSLLTKLPEHSILICFHGKPRIWEAAREIDWVWKYISGRLLTRIVSVIIPYKIDRGWLQDAIDSVPKSVELILAQGEYSWPKNFNYGLKKASGNYIKFLHEDDILTPNCIEDSLNTFENQNVDFIHGVVFEYHENTKRKILRKSIKPFPTLPELIKLNSLHCASLMYKKSIFEKIGGLNESLNNQEEYEFNLRCLKNGFKIGYCEQPLAIYRRHNGQKVRNITRTDVNQEKQKVKQLYV